MISILPGARGRSLGLNCLQHALKTLGLEDGNCRVSNCESSLFARVRQRGGALRSIRLGTVSPPHASTVQIRNVRAWVKRSWREQAVDSILRPHAWSYPQ